MSLSLSVDVGKGLWQYVLPEGVGNDVCKGTLAIIALSQLASLVESMCKCKTRDGTASTGGLARMDGFRSALSLSVYDTFRPGQQSTVAWRVLWRATFDDLWRPQAIVRYRVLRAGTGCGGNRRSSDIFEFQAAIARECWLVAQKQSIHTAVR
jgi:hypothetical protein